MLFTIITCTYNAAKYIDRTLESVRGQSYPHIEHFIIDGVSSDDTVKKAQTYAYDSRYPVIVKSESDNGLYDAMNKGIQLAKGDYIIFKGIFLRKRRLSPPETLSWESFKEGMLVCHQAFYARTDIAKQVPYNLDYKYSADVDWCIRIMKEAEKLGLELMNSHETLCSYLKGGMTTQSHQASLIERFKIMSHHYGTLTTIFQHLWFVIRAILKR